MDVLVIVIDSKTVTRLACVGLAIYAWKKFAKGVNDELN